MVPRDSESGSLSSSLRGSKLIDLQSAVPDKAPWRFLHNLIGLAEKVLAVNKINTIHQSLPPGINVDDFCRYCLKALNIEYALTEEELNRIPARGPLVLVANYSFGGVEGIILSEVLLQARPDVRILGNYLLARIPELLAILYAGGCLF
jgi:putative hemolysin